MLRNDDGRYDAAAAPAALVPGGELLVAPGYVTANGAESSGGPRFWITRLRRLRRGGTSTVELEAVDGWGLLRAWTAPRQLVWAAGDDSAFLVLAQIAQRAGLGASLSGGSAEATALKPAFTVRAGERGSAAIARLVDALPDVLVVGGLTAVLTEPQAGDPAVYSYGTDHALLGLEIAEGATPAGWARVFGDGLFAEAVDVERLRAGAGAVIALDDNLDVQARADARAATLLRQSELSVRRGELIVRPNAGQEVADVIDVSDPSLGASAVRYRVAALRLRFARAGPRPRYEMTLSLSAV